MVSANYDIFNRQDIPDFILCNPSGEQLYSLKSASKKGVTRRFNAVSEVNIEIPKEVNGVEIPAYDFLKQKRLILVDDNQSGYFVIVDVQEDSDGSIPKKIVKGLSIDYNLVERRLSAFGGTYPLYDPVVPTNSLLGAILEYIPSWSIGDVDIELVSTFRTFDVADTNIYEFLVTDVEEAYNCVILFDTINKEISAKLLDNVTTDTDVFISHHNLINTSSFKEISDELSTALNVTGGGNLSINAVNPLGTNIIYNFDYYKDGDGWMSAGLVSAIEAWEAVILANQPTYASTLASLKTDNEELLVLNGELAELEAEYLALEGVRLVRIGEDGGGDLGTINDELDAKQVEIDSKSNEVSNKETEIASLRDILESINDAVSFETNFSVSQLEELDYFIVENSYQNENIIQLDTDTPDVVQTQAQILYDQGVEVLERISQPKYEFSIDSVDMLSLKEFESVSDQLELGSIVHMQNASNQNLQLILLEIQYDYENPHEFNLVFSNRLRLANGAFMYSDLFGKAVKTGNKVSYDNYKWGDWVANSKDDVTTFISSNLDASVNALVNGTNEELLINENGLRLREWDADAGDYDPSQLWMNSKSLMFTTDNWNTASLGVGKITHDGSDVYGVIGGAIVGTILAGNELRIANENNNFTLDATGASLINASFTLSTTDGKNEISIDPTVGIKITKDDGGTPVDTFYLDSNGNAIFSGKLKAASGDFTGTITAEAGFLGRMALDSNGIYIDNTHYISHYDGGKSEIKWGGLWLKKNGDAQISGDIIANSFTGIIDWNNIVNTPIPASQFGGAGSGYSADGIDTGSLSGSRVYGGSLGGDGIQVKLSGTGFPQIIGSVGVGLYSSSSNFELGNNYLSSLVNGSIQLQATSAFNIYCGSFSLNGSTGLSRYVYYKDWSSVNRYMRFQNGILVTAS